MKRFQEAMPVYILGLNLKGGDPEAEKLTE
jgi:hypothetical protein